MDPEKVKCMVFDYDGTFEDWEKILFIDNLFLGIVWEKQKAKQEQEEAEAKKNRRR
jgi:hypothetical protein